MKELEPLHYFDTNLDSKYYRVFSEVFFVLLLNSDSDRNTQALDYTPHGCFVPHGNFGCGILQE